MIETIVDPNDDSRYGTEHGRVVGGFTYANATTNDSAMNVPQSVRTSPAFTGASAVAAADTYTRARSAGDGVKRR